MRSIDFRPLTAKPHKPYIKHNAYLDFLASPIDVKRILTPITEPTEVNNPRFQQMRNNVILIDKRIKDIRIDVADVEPWETVYDFRNSTFRAPLTFYDGDYAPVPKLSPLDTDVDVLYSNSSSLIHEAYENSSMKMIHGFARKPKVKLLDTNVDLVGPLSYNLDYMEPRVNAYIPRPQQEHKLIRLDGSDASNQVENRFRAIEQSRQKAYEQYVNDYQPLIEGPSDMDRYVTQAAPSFNAIKQTYQQPKQKMYHLAAPIYQEQAQDLNEPNHAFRLPSNQKNDEQFPKIKIPKDKLVIV